MLRKLSRQPSRYANVMSAIAGVGSWPSAARSAYAANRVAAPTS